MVKNINLFLMDGAPTGRIKCTVPNWTGLAYKIPRTELDKCKGRTDLSQSGVYFLFGTSDQTDKDMVYIGQAGVRKSGEGLLNRLQEHKRNPDKDYWTEAVVFTTSNNSFGPTEISYLENRFCNLAMKVGRFIVKNGNDPTSGHITEEKESELEEFIDKAKIVLGTLGYKVFEPLVQTIGQSSLLDDKVQQDEQLLFIKGKDVNAKAKLTSEGIVILAGSIIRENTVPSCPPSAKKIREDNLEYIDKNNVLLIDFLFKSPSGASDFVLGASTNGNKEWKTIDGKTLKDTER